MLSGLFDVVHGTLAVVENLLQVITLGLLG